MEHEEIESEVFEDPNHPDTHMASAWEIFRSVMAARINSVEYESGTTKILARECFQASMDFQEVREELTSEYENEQ